MSTLALVYSSAAQVIHYLPPLNAPHAAPPGLLPIVAVFDARPAESTVLGYSLAGGAGPQPVTFAQGVAPALRAFLAQYVPGNAPTGRQLALRLTRLEVTETRVLATAALDAEFYLLQPDSSYQLVARFAEQTRRSLIGGREAALVSHSLNLATLLANAAGVAGNPTHWLADGPRVAGTQLRAGRPALTATWPILAEGATRQAGFYATFRDFLLNQPTEGDRLEVERHPQRSVAATGNEVQPFRRYGPNERYPAVQGWGFSDGQHAYIHQAGGYFRLQRQGNRFVFFTVAGSNPAVRNALNALALTAMVTTGTPRLLIGGSSEQRQVCYELDLTTGEVAPLATDRPLPSLVGRPAQIFVYRPRQAKGAAVQIQLDPNQPAKSLAAGDYLHFSPPADQPLTVRLQPGAGSEIVLPILPTAGVPIYLECRPADVIPLRQVKTTVGEAAVTRLLD